MADDTLRTLVAACTEDGLPGCTRDGVTTIELESWDAFCSEMLSDVQQQKDNRTAIWRGQSLDHPLLSTLERSCHDSGDPGRDRAKHLERFKRASFGRLGQFIRPHDDQILRWWALGQHYGLDTPLLDWTRSPFVALFFAFAEPTERLAVGDPRAVYRLLTCKSKIEVRPTPGMDEITVVEPLSDDNARLISQQGVFTITHPGQSIADVISARSKGQHVGNQKVTMLWKYLIQDEDREGCLKSLNHMNINYSTLFPDVDGVARHCNMSRLIEGY